MTELSSRRAGTVGSIELNGEDVDEPLHPPTNVPTLRWRRKVLAWQEWRSDAPLPVVLLLVARAWVSRQS
jgi:hypothetical protein